ncbi:MAG: outer-membrane lipoprotein carrier protein LolA [Bacteroidetes bacterium]|nr:outer-membrane lipoprotein carrier protein LolA [Bacteroidota bacterium]MBU1117110.1 outer-membrane lipoprotein carrier protein LolA [Bacteroidota bacterium]MBU1798641.1 outer-membrane lipoprotein carrier protein LolA [Bacteroidota bacterium]
MILKLLFIIAIPFCIYAQNADEVIKNLQDKFTKTQTLKAEFTQTIFSTQSNQSIKFEGEFYFKKENSFSIVLPNRNIISDGKSVWNFDKASKKVIISPFENGNTTFSLNEIIFSYPQKCDLLLLKSENNNYLIKGVPKDLDYSFKEAYLTISKDYLLNAIEIIDFNNMKYTFQLFSVEINQKIDDAKFQFNQSKEIEIIDLR